MNRLCSLIYRPEGLLVATFALLILIGTIALALDPCQTSNNIDLLDAFFTATSAVCVTGLITHDTATEFTRDGQIVILILIQIGGLGLMTFGALAFQLIRRRVSFHSYAALQDLFFQGELRGSLKKAIRRIVLLTMVFEVVGATLLYCGLAGPSQPEGGLFEALFMSVSAFCNAGFSVYSDSVISLRESRLVMWTLMLLIVGGGVGYLVHFELLGRLWQRLRHPRQYAGGWSLHTRVVVTSSGILIGLGMLGMLLTGLTTMEQSIGDRLLNSLFQSVTARTAGFNSVDLRGLSVPALMVLMPLMFIGGSPGSCAGGIKTTSMSVWLARIRGRISGSDDIVLADRRIPLDVVRRANLIIALAILWNMIGVAFLAFTEQIGDTMRFEQIIFEQISAFGTVGLSTGITANLSTAGKLWIILSMFAGRLGPLTIALAVMRGRPELPYTYPEERVMIG